MNDDKPQTDFEDLQALVKALQRENEALRKDKQRLDWLGKHTWSILVCPNSGETPIRAAVDKLMNDTP